MTETRPALTNDMSSQELLRWYWLRSELAGFARSLGVAASGSKQELTERVATRLDGGTPARTDPGRPASPPPLSEPLTSTTRIPAGQRCTQQLRRYLADAIGPTFHFDQAMREFIASGAGQTLGAAVDHWYTTRSQPRPEIGAQFELNRFLRDWHQNHPDGSRAEALSAWGVHRALPAEARPGLAPVGSDPHLGSVSAG